LINLIHFLIRNDERFTGRCCDEQLLKITNHQAMMN